MLYSIHIFTKTLFIRAYANNRSHEYGTVQLSVPYRTVLILKYCTVSLIEKRAESQLLVHLAPRMTSPIAVSSTTLGGYPSRLQYDGSAS
jgi:hypothetical protein